MQTHSNTMQEVKLLVSPLKRFKFDIPSHIDPEKVIPEMLHDLGSKGELDTSWEFISILPSLPSTEGQRSFKIARPPKLEREKRRKQELWASRKYQREMYVFFSLSHYLSINDSSAGRFSRTQRPKNLHQWSKILHQWSKT